MRYFITLSYDGTAYHGWQVQPGGVASVQQELQRALSTLLRTPTEVTGAGRTDAGVHARMQVAHFDVPHPIDAAQMAYKLNRLLPRDISVETVEPVADSLHARFSAVSRAYHYYIHTHKDPFLRNTSWETHYDLDFPLMNQAAAMLIEYSDFGAFCKSHADVKTTLCDVTEAHWDPLGQGRWCFVIAANRFLRNMVRAVVGTLIDVGRHRITIEQFRSVVEGRRRTDAGESVPAKGLFLWRIDYPSTNIPTADTCG